MKKLVFLTVLFLMFFVVTTAHALTCAQKIEAKVASGKIITMDQCMKIGAKICGQTSEAELFGICQSFELMHEQSWSDVVVDRVAIEQRVLKQIRERAEKTKVRNNRTYY